MVAVNVVCFIEIREKRNLVVDIIGHVVVSGEHNNRILDWWHSFKY